MAALLMFETAVSQIASPPTGHSPVVGPSEVGLAESWCCQSSGPVFSLLPLKVTRGQCIRCEVLSEYSHARAPRSTSPLYGAEGRGCQGKGGGMCVGVSLGNLGSVRPCVWLQLHRRLACGAKPCPAFSPVSDSCSLGVGALVSCNSCDVPPHPPLALSSQWAIGRGGRWPAVPEAHYSMCACAWVCTVRFWWPERGPQG